MQHEEDKWRIRKKVTHFQFATLLTLVVLAILSIWIKC